MSLQGSDHHASHAIVQNTTIALLSNAKYITYLAASSTQSSGRNDRNGYASPSGLAAPLPRSRCSLREAAGSDRTQRLGTSSFRRVVSLVHCLIDNMAFPGMGGGMGMRGQQAGADPQQMQEQMMIKSVCGHDFPTNIHVVHMTDVLLCSRCKPSWNPVQANSSSPAPWASA